MAQSYRALTRTYRPHTFDDIVSQDHVSSTLKNAIKQNRLSHAYMFCGPRGVGKTTMARVLARTINSIGSEVDGESLSQTLNVVEIDAASNNKVEDVHHLRESVRIPPQNGRYKVFIIDEVHMLSKAAFNALLKTLEEPPDHAIFIFATTEPHKVLPTILSRVQRFDFKRISVDEIVERLKVICSKEEITIDDESLHVIANKADGALRDALGLMDQAIAFCGSDIKYEELLKALNVVGNEQLFRFTESVEKKDADTGLKLTDSLLKDGVDIQEFLAALTNHIRNLYVAKNSERMYLVDATAETRDRYRKVSEAFTEEDLMRMMHMVSEAQIKIKDVQQPRVHFEILLLKLIHMNRSRELNELLTELKEVKKKSLNNPLNRAYGANSTGRQVEENEDDQQPSEKANIAGNESKPEPEYNDLPRVEEEPEEMSTDDEPAAGQKSDEEEEDDFLSAKPTLGFASGISSKSSGGNGTSEEISRKEITEEGPGNGMVVQSIEELRECWQQVITVCEKEAPRMLYFEVKKLSLRDLNGTELKVSTDNEFAKTMLHENETLLAGIMKKVTGRRIRFQCVVERAEKKEESLSPYERFKELQQKDPKLKSVVELFGAELEY